MKKITLLQQKPILLRKDTLAFIIMFGVIAPLLYNFLPIEFLFIKFFLVLAFFFNCLFFLINETNDRYKIKNRFNEMKNIKAATHVNFRKINKHKKEEINVIKLETIKIDLSNGDRQQVTYFYRHKLKYYWQIGEKRFKKIQPFIEQNIGDLVENKCQFFVDELEQKLIDDNNLVFPLPDFKTLFKQQIMDPLNFFQLFSVALWFFDDNFFHPLLMLFLLFITNFSVCMQRISTILNLRSLQTKAYEVSVWNKQKKSYEKKSSEKLIPGDIIKLKRSKELKPTKQKYKNERDLLNELKRIVPFGDKLPPQILLKFVPKATEQKEIVNSSDILILKGNVAVDESILTGENLPQIKDPITHKYYHEKFDKKIFKNNIIYAGTDIVQTTSQKKNEDVLGIVLNTGFNTTKGKLARTVLFGEESKTPSQKDSYVLLFLLLLVSIIASIYVLIKGLGDEERNKDKLFIRCILIVTSVVPPELPMIMTMAVNNSLLYLKKKRLFCTEPHRIQLAGKIEICVFDKTGTLTQEQLILKGVVLREEKGKMEIQEDLRNSDLKDFDNMSMILGGCQSLVEIENNLVGDPIEMLFFQNSDFRFDYSNMKSFHFKQSNKYLQIRKIFYFNSDLKRMSSIIRTNQFGDSKKNYLVVKGAPEIIGTLLKDKPDYYEDWYRNLANKGYRLLSLAIKELPQEEINEEDRFKLEKDLTFIGFFVLTNYLKKDTKFYIKQIHDSGRDVIILTGDHLLTSIQTYKSLEISEKQVLIVSTKDSKINYESIDGKKVIPTKLEDYDLTISGEHLLDILALNPKIAFHLKVIARVNPKQKEIYIGKLKHSKKVLMCGDGTNDVGALKRADVGIALVGKKDEPTKALKLERQKKKKDMMKKALKERRLPKPNELNFDNEDLDFKLGDASIAAPFTNKHSNSIKCVLTILKQGLTTLTCGIQSYKIVTLTSLLSAYSLSTLHLQNLKFSDMQNTVMGIYGAYLYFTLSSGKPVKRLSKDRPKVSIFNRYFWISLSGQLVLQFLFLFLMMDFAKKYAPDSQKEVDNEDEFVPTFINSVMFLYELASMFCISIFNYEGRPFMKSLSENKKHFKFLLIPIFLLLLLIFNVSEDLSTLFQTTFESKNPESENYLFVMTFGFISLCFFWTNLVKYFKLGRLEKLI